jgi:hypothetical protein
MCLKLEASKGGDEASEIGNTERISPPSTEASFHAASKSGTISKKRQERYEHEDGIVQRDQSLERPSKKTRVE